jgi:hypothetical protein
MGHPDLAYSLRVCHPAVAFEAAESIWSVEAVPDNEKTRSEIDHAGEVRG